MLEEILFAINECGVRVLSITFDGFSTNFSMCSLFGASFDMSDCRPYFSSPNDDRKIYIILDPSHMEKLARNCIAGNKTLYDDDDSAIEWNFLNLWRCSGWRNN